MTPALGGINDNDPSLPIVPLHSLPSSLGSPVVYCRLLPRVPQIHPELLTAVNVQEVPNMIPIIFLSLVYHNIVPTICTQLRGNVPKIRTAIVAGTAIPALGFVLWDAVALGYAPFEAGVDPLVNLAQQVKRRVGFRVVLLVLLTGAPAGGIRALPSVRPTGRGGGHLGLTHAEPQRGRLWTACGQRRVDSKTSQTTPTTISTSSIRQLLGTATAPMAPAATSIAPAHQPLGSANAETTPARAPAAAADRTQRPNATCEGKNGCRQPPTANL